MKPIFPVNLCKLVDRLFTEFENADCIKFTRNDYLTIVVNSLGQKLAVIHLGEKVFLTDIAPNTTYEAYKTRGKIKYWINDKEAVNGLELEESIKKLRAIINSRHENGIILLDIEKELMEPLKVLDSVF